MAEDQYRSLPREQYISLFVHLRQEGSLQGIIEILKAHQETLQRRIDQALETFDITTLSTVRAFGVLQGRLAETKRLVRVFDAWGNKDVRYRGDDGELVE